MNRRSAMLLTMLMGGIFPKGLSAQTPPNRRTSNTGKKAGGGTLKPVKTANEMAGDDDAESKETDQVNETPQSLPAEPGQRYKTYDITPYTSLPHDPKQSNPQNAIIEWIFRRTGNSAWHGEKLAALSVSKTQLRAYNNTKILQEVSEVVDRFVNAKEHFLEVHVRFVAAIDTRWRYAVYSNLTHVTSGPQGQQIWTMNSKEAAIVLTQMQTFQGYRLLLEQKLEMPNGQTLTVAHTEPRSFTGGMQRESAGGVGNQPKAEKLDEGITLKFSPLLNLDGDALDAAIDLGANTVKSLHRTRVIAGRSMGPPEMTIDIPEVVESRLSQTIKDWPVGQTLLIAAGIHPGILQNKGGFMNLRIPGTVPSGTELLVFIDVEYAPRSRPTAKVD